MLHINSVLHGLALGDRGLGEVLTTTELLENARALVLTHKLLQGALDVLALLNRHDNHSCILFFVLLFFLSFLWQDLHFKGSLPHYFAGSTSPFLTFATRYSDSCVPKRR